MSSTNIFQRFSPSKSDQARPADNVIYDRYGESDRETDERLAAIFKQLDHNGNGRIDIQELTASLKDLGLAHQYAEVNAIRSSVKFRFSLAAQAALALQHTHAQSHHQSHA